VRFATCLSDALLCQALDARLKAKSVKPQVALIPVPDEEVLDLQAAASHKIVRWFTQRLFAANGKDVSAEPSNRKDIDDVLERTLSVTLRKPDTKARDWRMQGNHSSVGIFENKAMDVQINVQSSEIFFHMNHIQPVFNDVSECLRLQLFSDLLVL